MAMLSVLLARPHPKKFLKLNLSRKFNRQRKLSKKARISFIRAKPVRQADTVKLAKEIRMFKANKRADNKNNNSSYTIPEVKYSIHDAKQRVESVLLLQRQDLFPSSLSRNAIRRLVRESAKDVASLLGVPRKKFKATRKWLNDFLERCEKLGFLTDSDKLNDTDTAPKNVNEKATRNIKNDSNHVTPTQSEDVTAYVSSTTVPRIENLFGTSVPTAISHHTPSNDLKVELPLEKTKQSASLLKLFFVPDTPGATNQRKRKHGWTVEKSRYFYHPKRSTMLFCETNVPSYNTLFSSRKTGFELDRNDMGVNRSYNTIASNDVYEDLFHHTHAYFGTEAKTNSSANAKTCSFESDGADSGYRSRSESQNMESTSPPRHTLPASIQKETNSIPMPPISDNSVTENPATACSMEHHLHQSSNQQSKCNKLPAPLHSLFATGGCSNVSPAQTNSDTVTEEVTNDFDFLEDIDLFEQEETANSCGLLTLIDDVNWLDQL